MHGSALYRYGNVALVLNYEGRLKSNAHMLVEREQKQIARSGKKYMKVQACVHYFSAYPRN
jgi:hypothetical protein